MAGGDVIVQFGVFRVYAMGAAIAVGFLLMAAVSIPEGRRRGLPRRDLLDLMVWLMVGCIVGARLVAVSGEWGTTLRQPLDLFRVPPDGLSFYGGLIVGVLLVTLFAARRRLRVWTLLDTLTPGAAFGITWALAIWSSSRATGSVLGLPWLGALVVTGAYLVTAWIWYRRGRTRFDGELFLTVVAYDALVRWLLGPFYAAAVLSDTGSSRAAPVALGMVALLWFYLRGVSLRSTLPRRPAGGSRPISKARWIAGYVVLLGVMLLRARAAG